MSSLLHHGKEDEEDEEEQEITLSTASLLGLFLGLVLICGVFFGFGYSVGRRSPANAASSVPDTAPEPDQARQASAKSSPSPSPSAAQPEANDPLSASPDDSSLQSADDSSLPTPADSSLQPAADSPVPVPAVLPIVEKPIRKKPLPSPVNLAATASPAGKAGQAMVQIAAVGRREDADVLASALRQRGYGVVVRSEPQDKLLHVQVGPFPSRAQANAMRQKLLSDGYNAIIKQ